MTTAWTLTATTLLAAAAVMTAAALWSRHVQRYAVVDAAWGAAFVLIAVATGIVATALDADGPARRWLLVGLVALWGLRLTRHLWNRVSTSGHDDPRYEEMLGGSYAEVPFGTVVRKVFLLQGAAVALISAPVVVGTATPTRWPWAVVLGVVLWLVGVAFEAVGDAQLAAYRSRPRADRPPVLDTGLWAWTRHPNYFGDFCVWWGLWLAGGLATGPIAGLTTLPAPLLMTWFLTVVSGARLTDRRMAGRPGWDAYAARTPMFVPRPPRR
jgi:steroid 5-alpha reductase family enzyme